MDKNFEHTRTIFRIMSNGLQTKRDDWVYDFDRSRLEEKIKDLVDGYECARSDLETANMNHIKWDRELSRHLQRKTMLQFDKRKIVISTYRPFTQKFVYYDRLLNSQSFQLHHMYRNHDPNITITFLSVSSANPIAVLAVPQLFDTCLLKMGNGSTQGLSRYRISREGGYLDNITDWALEQFREHYAAEERLIPDLPEKNSGGSPPPKPSPIKGEGLSRSPSPLMGEGRGGGDAAHRFLSSGRGVITKDAIFHYVYGVLHNPAYREKYALNLKREFPRIPFCADFRRWAAWGERLMALHIGYESVEPWPLTRLDVPDEKSRAAGLSPRVLLRADKAAGIILIDSETQLGGVPKEAWDYRLGNRSALEWVLDQHREKTPKDPTIRARFNTYRFADHKERVIDLLKRVARVSVKTMAILAEMREAGGER